MIKAYLLKVALMTICLLSWSLNSYPSGKDFFLPQGIKFFQNYNPREFRISPQNWSIVEDKDGIIYVGNQAGLMQFDGVTWKWFNIPNQTVKSMAIDQSGVIYLGGNDELGFLEHGKMGQIEYRSLSTFLPEGCDSFGNVRKTYAFEGKIFFQTRKFLFQWNGKKMKVWKASGRFYLSFLCNGKFFVRQANTGLMQMEGEELNPAVGGDFFTNKPIYIMVPFDKERILIGTESHGFYLYDGKQFKTFAIEAESYLKKNKLYHGIRTSSGDFALATLRGGVVIIDRTGKLKGIYNRAVGLQDDNVKYVYEDRWHNLWLGLEFGVAKLEYSSPFNIYNVGAGLFGQVLATTRHRGKLYAGTTRGLFLREGNGYFKKIIAIDEQCRWLLSTENELLAASGDGVFLVDDNRTQKILSSYSYMLLQSTKDSNRIWVGTRNGLMSLYRDIGNSNSSWRVEYRFKEIDHKIVTIIENSSGNLWLGTLTQGVWNVQIPLNGELRGAKSTHYSSSNHLPEGEINIFQIAGHVMFATIKKGILQFDETHNKFIPDVTLGKKFADGSRSVFRIVEDNKKNIWFHSRHRNYCASPHPGKGYSVKEDALLRLPDIPVNVIYPDPIDDTVWFGSGEGLFCYDYKRAINDRKTFSTLIRQILVDGKPFAFNLTNEDESTEPHVFSHHEGNIRFQFCAPFFEAEKEIRFSYFLEGNDECWSPWARETQSVYTNLPPGYYTFRVKARNVYGETGRDAVYRFWVSTPWYSSWWAIVFYVLGGVAVITLGIKWRGRKLEKEKQQLEGIVKIRTKELKDKNRQLELQTLRLKKQSKKLEEMSEMKSKFFANISHEFRTPLTLIMGPIEQLKDQLTGSRQEKQLDVMQRNVSRLLNLINQLLDLSRLNSGKLQLRAAHQNIVPFVRGIVSAFHLKALEKKINLTFSTANHSIFLYFDNDKVEKIVGNLLINALRYTPGGEYVTVTLKIRQADKRSSSTDMLELSIKDTGVGIPKEQLPFIFDRFYRVERPDKGESETAGSGIGLALTRELVELHGGRIDVHSGEGVGTECVVLLPLGKAHLKKDEILTAPPKQPDFEESRQLTSILTSPVKVGEEVDGRQRTERNLILVVEDNVEMLDFISQSLSPYYIVKKAINGEEGLEKAKQLIPDLIISDVMMPRMQGDELCHRLKSDLETSHIPIILLTAKASEDSIVKGYETGADDYVLKPFNIRILLSRIKNLIEIRRQLQLRIQEQGLEFPEGLAISPMDKEFLAELHTIVQKSLSNPDFNVEKLCKKLYIPKTSLNRKMKALIDETPNQYIQSCRLERAEKLLKAGQGNVTEIAFQVGFSSSSYFSRCFKDKYGRLPSNTKTPETK